MSRSWGLTTYLKEKPPVFLVALGIGGVLVVTLLAVLVRLFTNWFFALPLVLFEKGRPVQRITGKPRSSPWPPPRRAAMDYWLAVGDYRVVRGNDDDRYLARTVIRSSCHRVTHAAGGRHRRDDGTLGRSRSGCKLAQHDVFRRHALQPLSTVRQSGSDRFFST